MLTRLKFVQPCSSHSLHLFYYLLSHYHCSISVTVKVGFCLLYAQVSYIQCGVRVGREPAIQSSCLSNEPAQMDIPKCKLIYKNKLYAPSKLFFTRLEWAFPVSRPPETPSLQTIGLFVRTKGLHTETRLEQPDIKRCKTVV